jgi:hypothetical protein
MPSGRTAPLPVLFLAALGLAVAPPAARAPEPAAGTRPPVARAALDLTGRWLLRHVVRQSDRPSYRGLVLLFRVDLVQHGATVTGTAVKWRENGRPVAGAARSRLRLDGRVDGDVIVGRFVETAGGRTRAGSFRWRYSLKEGWLTGTFRTDVASAEGDSTAVAIG